MLEYNRKAPAIPEGLRERYCSWFLYCFIRVEEGRTQGGASGYALQNW